MLVGITSRANTMTPQESSSRGAAISAQDVDLRRKDLRAKRKELIAANLKLTDAEGERLWREFKVAGWVAVSRHAPFL